MEEQNNKILAMIIMYVLVIIIAVVAGFTLHAEFVEPETKFVTVYEEKVQPMLLVEFLEWGESADNSNEYLFDYWIYNFGNVEARDVQVICKITDGSENVIKEEVFDVGNVASNSYHYELETIEYYGYADNYYGMCYIHNADGDYLNLEKRIE